MKKILRYLRTNSKGAIMRRKESYYLQLQKEFQNFLQTLENQELFLLKSAVRTKAFKDYLKNRELNKKIPSLLEYYGIKN